MSQAEPGFDDFSERYNELLRDPVREVFSGGTSEFFHLRKRDLICDYFRRHGQDTRTLTHLDLGCGRGELLRLLRKEFARVCGCDPSGGMLGNGGLAGAEIEVRRQDVNVRIPFESTQFDCVTAVCVYHHVPPSDRGDLMGEVVRVLKPGGVLALIEHNPYNPLTRLIVSRTPVDADAVLLRSAEARALVRSQGLTVDDQQYFLYLPDRVYGKLKRLEPWLRSLPLGGQYAVFAKKR